MNKKLKRLFKEYHKLIAEYEETGDEKKQLLAYRRINKIIAFIKTSSSV